MKKIKFTSIIGILLGAVFLYALRGNDSIHDYILVPASKYFSDIEHSETKAIPESPEKNFVLSETATARCLTHICTTTLEAIEERLKQLDSKNHINLNDNLDTCKLKTEGEELENSRKSAENYFKEALSLGIIDNDPCLSLAIFKINENNFKEATPILKKLCDRFSSQACLLLSRLDSSGEVNHLIKACSIDIAMTVEDDGGDEGHDYGLDIDSIKSCMHGNVDMCRMLESTDKTKVENYACSKGSAQACLSLKKYEDACKLGSPVGCWQVNKKELAIKYARESCEDSNSFNLTSLSNSCSSGRLSACQRLADNISRSDERVLEPFLKILCEHPTDTRHAGECIKLASIEKAAGKIKQAEVHLKQGCTKVTFAGCEAFKESKEERLAILNFGCEMGFPHACETIESEKVVD
jgi:hypothetical protein